MLREYAQVCYELLRPQQIKEIREQNPIVYIPVGSLEWHGRQNPLGTDGLKAHSVCCEAALAFGGVVLPPYYLGLLGHLKCWGPSGWEGYTLGFNEEESFRSSMQDLCRALVNGGWKVLAGVTGHDVSIQRDSLWQAISSATDGTHSTGFAVMEGEMHHPDKEIPWEMDHAAAWETSCMLYAYPESVDLNQLKNSPDVKNDRLIVDWEALNYGAEGINGMNPCKYATRKMGRVIIKRMAALIGEKACSMLRQLPSLSVS
jgi:creatinine amidohydrolase